MQDQDIRWQQRLNNYSLALARLADAVALGEQRALTSLEQQGLIQAFEFTHELAWNVMKDYLYWQGDASVTGSRDAARAAFSVGLVDDGEGWMAMIRSRNQSSHTYNQSIADAIAHDITHRYFSLLQAFEGRMRGIERGLV